MFNVKKTAAMAAIATLGMGVVSGASAQQFIHEGPVEFQGFISVDNTAPGGAYTDFNCKVKGYGRIFPGSNRVIVIEGIQALNHSAGEIAVGCATVSMNALPWTLTMGAVPISTVPPYLETYAAALNGVDFISSVPGSVGCSGAVNGEWTQNPVPGSPGFVSASYSRLQLTNAATTNGCILNGVIKFTRLYGPVIQ